MFERPDPILLPERPRCARCQARMRLGRIQPLPDRSEKRVFECPKCDLVETKIIADPFMSEPISRLTEGIKPPS
jgi:hypothetical protein